MFKDYWDSPIAMERLMAIQTAAIKCVYALYSEHIIVRMMAYKAGLMRNRIRMIDPATDNGAIVVELMHVID